MADVSWRDLFNDEQLKSYIEEGLENNIDIRIALQNVMAAEAYVKQGKAGYYPTLSGTASFTRTKNSRNSQFGSFFTSALEQYELSGALSWEADVWGKIRSNKRAFGAAYLQLAAALLQYVGRTPALEQIPVGLCCLYQAPTCLQGRQRLEYLLRRQK